MTNKEFRKKYTIIYLYVSEILKLDSNKIKINDIIKPDLNLDLNQWSENRCKGIVDENNFYFHNAQMNSKIGKIFGYIFIIFFSLFWILFFSGFGLNITVLTEIGKACGIISLLFFIFSFNGLLNSTAGYFKNKDVLDEIKNYFIQNLENFPLTIRLLYFPEEEKYLRKYSKLKTEITRNVNYIKGEMKYSYTRFTNKTRQCTEWNIFVTKFANYVLDTYYKK